MLAASRRNVDSGPWKPIPDLANAYMCGYSKDVVDSRKWADEYRRRLLGYNETYTRKPGTVLADLRGDERLRLALRAVRDLRKHHGLSLPSYDSLQAFEYDSHEQRASAQAAFRAVYLSKLLTGGDFVSAVVYLSHELGHAMGVTVFSACSYEKHDLTAMNVARRGWELRSNSLTFGTCLGYFFEEVCANLYQDWAAVRQCGLQRRTEMRWYELHGLGPLNFSPLLERTELRDLLDWHRGVPYLRIPTRFYTGANGRRHEDCYWHFSALADLLAEELYPSERPSRARTKFQRAILSIQCGDNTPHAFFRDVKKQLGSDGLRFLMNLTAAGTSPINNQSAALLHLFLAAKRLSPADCAEARSLICDFAYGRPHEKRVLDRFATLEVPDRQDIFALRHLRGTPGRAVYYQARDAVERLHATGRIQCSADIVSLLPEIMPILSSRTRLDVAWIHRGYLGRFRDRISAVLGRK